MPIFCVARGIIEWMCTQERWNPEVAIIFSAAAHYRRATVGSSHDDAHPDNSTLHTRAVRPHTGFAGSLFFISPRTGRGSSQVFEMLEAGFVETRWGRFEVLVDHKHSELVLCGHHGGSRVRPEGSRHIKKVMYKLIRSFDSGKGKRQTA
jgi:hypothetical protein